MLPYIMILLAIDTSCDDTSASVLSDDVILSNVVSSQIEIHQKWGGVVPNLAKRAHIDKIDNVIKEALTVLNPKSEILKSKQSRNSNTKTQNDEFGGEMEKIDVIVVTQGPGLSPALGVGVDKAKELVKKYKKKLVAVNHIKGHLLSVFLKSKQDDLREIDLPALALTVSGGHSMIVRILPDFKYEVVGTTLDDAAGEALDKASKLLGLGYPGGPIIEKMAKTGDINFLKLPRPMKGHKGFDLSFSGLKTSFYYSIKDWSKEKIEANVENLAASFQEAVFDSLMGKYVKAIEEYETKSLIGVGGVMNNETLRQKIEKTGKQRGLSVYFPHSKALNGDNAAMIGMVGFYKAKRGQFVKDVDSFDRDARLEL